MTHTLEIPMWRPTPLNHLVGNHHKAARLKRADADIVRAYSMRDRTPMAVTRRRVDLFIVPGANQRPCDKDAYWKSGLDALVLAGLLVNDSGTWCEPGTVTHGTRKADGPPRTVITLTDLD